MSISVTIEFDEAAIRDLERIPELLRMGPIDRCMRAMAKPVIQRAKHLAPSSRASGSRKKWSKKLKNDSKWSGVDSGQHMGAKLFRGSKTTRIYIGAKYPQGNKQQFDASPKGRKVVLWGRRTSTIRQRPNPTFIEQAYRDTLAQQQAAFRTQLEKEIKELRIG